MVTEFVMTCFKLSDWFHWAMIYTVDLVKRFGTLMLDVDPHQPDLLYKVLSCNEIFDSKSNSVFYFLIFHHPNHKKIESLIVQSYSTNNLLNFQLTD